MIEPKEDGDAFHSATGPAQFGLLDQVVLGAFGPERTLTPDDVTLPGKTLRESITTAGWPETDALRGQVLFLVDGSEGNAYSSGYTSLAGRAMFVQAEGDQAAAAFVSRDGVRLAGEGKYDRMRRLVGQNFMVRDYVQPPEFEASKVGGAHFISSDDPDQLVLSAEPLAPSRCNPISGSLSCTDLALERHEQGGYEPTTHPGDAYDQVLRDKARRTVCHPTRSAAALAGAPDPGCLAP